MKDRGSGDSRVPPWKGEGAAGAADGDGGARNVDVKTSSKHPLNLLSIAVGIKQKEIVNKIVEKFPSSDFIVMLFHYDGFVDGWKNLAWSNRAIHVSAINQTKWMIPELSTSLLIPLFTLGSLICLCSASLSTALHLQLSKLLLVNLLSLEPVDYFR